MQRSMLQARCCGKASKLATQMKSGRCCCRPPSHLLHPFPSLPLSPPSPSASSRLKLPPYERAHALAADGAGRSVAAPPQQGGGAERAQRAVSARRQRGLPRRVQAHHAAGHSGGGRRGGCGCSSCGVGVGLGPVLNCCCRFYSARIAAGCRLLRLTPHPRCTNKRPPQQGTDAAQTRRQRRGGGAGAGAGIGAGQGRGGGPRLFCPLLCPLLLPALPAASLGNCRWACLPQRALVWPAAGGTGWAGSLRPAHCQELLAAVSGAAAQPSPGQPSLHARKSDVRLRQAAMSSRLPMARGRKPAPQNAIVQAARQAPPPPCLPGLWDRGHSSSVAGKPTCSWVGAAPRSSKGGRGWCGEGPCTQQW